MFNQKINPSIDKSVWGTPECPEPCSCISSYFLCKGEEGESGLGAARIMGSHTGLPHDFSRTDVNKHLFSADKHQQQTSDTVPSKPSSVSQGSLAGAQMTQSSKSDSLRKLQPHNPWTTCRHSGFSENPCSLTIVTAYVTSGRVLLTL